MRIEKAFENKHVSLGVDKVTGVFIQIMTEDKISNWSEFYPFSKRLTFEAIKEIKTHFSKEEWKELQQVSLLPDDFNQKYWSLYFDTVITTKEVETDFKYPKALVDQYNSGKSIKVKTLGDYLKVLKYFKEPVTFHEVQWYEGIESRFYLTNDAAEKYLQSYFA